MFHIMHNSILHVITRDWTKYSYLGFMGSTVEYQWKKNKNDIFMPLFLTGEYK